MPNENNSQRPVSLGVTGGIGSGKTLVCSIFSTLGFPVYNADMASRNLLNTNSDIRESVVKLLGMQAYFPSGDADRGYIASVVFKDAGLLDKLNEILHPAVKNDFLKWTLLHGDKKLIVKEAAIMFESGSNNGMDYVLTVNASEDIRIRRVIARDGSDKGKVKRVIARQLTDEKRTALSDFTIINDDRTPVLMQVLTILEQIIPGDK